MKYVVTWAWEHSMRFIGDIVEITKPPFPELDPENKDYKRLGLTPVWCVRMDATEGGPVDGYHPLEWLRPLEDPIPEKIEKEQSNDGHIRHITRKSTPA